MIKNKKIVITGGAGFIGSNISRSLCSNNQVFIIDDLSTGDFNNIKDLIDSKKVEFIQGSITDIVLLMKFFKDVDYVFHQAAIPSVPRSIKDPVKTNEVNILGTLNVLIAARDNNIKKLVFASSSSIYGETNEKPIAEYINPHPLSPYAVSKISGEYYCNVFSSAYDLPTVCLRYFNVYGPYQDPNGDYASVIPRFINLVLNNKPPVVFGDGDQTRDFAFVSDVVNANVLAAESNKTGVFNIGSGKQVSINQLVKLINQLTKKNIMPFYKNPRPGDIKYSLADITKAKKLGYTSKYTIEKGLEETIKWFIRK